MKLEIGDKVFVPNEKRPYKVICRNDRYIICTKPFNLQHTVIYFIIDLEEQRRGPDDRIFCQGYETEEQCLANLKDLEEGFIQVSRRRGIPLDIDVN